MKLQRFAGVTLCMAAACADSEAPPEEDWKPLEPVVTEFAGKTLEEWGVEWSRWSYAQTSCDAPVIDEDGELCGLYQPEGPAFFLALGAAGTVRTECRVPRDKALVVPLGIFSSDNAGVENPVDESQLERAVAEVKNSMREFKLTADGTEITQLEERGFGPTRFSYRVPAAPNWYTCRGQNVADATVEPAFVGGYLAIFPSTPVGMHTLEYGSLRTYKGSDAVRSVTLTFSVE